MRFPRDHLAFTLTLGALKLLLLPLNPRQAMNNRQTNLIVIETLGS
jgi:hypothetical protein